MSSRCLWWDQAGVGTRAFQFNFCVANVFVRTLFLASVRQSFQFKLFGCNRLRHLDRTIDVASEIWNHSVALKNRYYKMFGKGLPKSRLQPHLAKLRRTPIPALEVGRLSKHSSHHCPALPRLGGVLQR